MDNNYTNNLTQALIKQREKMVSRMYSLKRDKVNISKLQKKLTKELKSTYSNNSNDSTENTNIEKIMKNKLMEIYNIDSQDLSIKGPSFSFSDLNKLIKIRNEINTLLQQNILSDKDIQQLETLFQTFSQIYSKKAENFNTDISDKDNLKDKIQKALNSASFREIEGSTLRGEFGETLVAYVGTKMQNKAREALNNLEESIVGSKTSKFQITTKQIPKNIGSKIINKQDSKKEKESKSKKKQQYNIYDIRSSQDKVDVIISESENSKKIKASIKTYQASKTSITTHLQDVSLLYILLATEKDFHKHWLNLHYMSKTSINENQLQKEKLDYDEELTKQILYEALVSGNLLKQQFSGQNSPEKANYMIAIDSNTGKVIIKSTYDLLSKAFHNEQNWDPFIIKPNIDSIKFSKLRRKHISNDDIYLHLIQKAQETKIKVSLKQMFS